jgi:hypothetical protein
MTILLITHQTRPNESVDFFSWTRSLPPDYMLINYMRPDKMLETAQDSMSADNLTKTTLIKFNSNDDLEQFRNDPVINQSRAAKNEYDSIHGIVVSSSTEEVQPSV